MNAATKHDCRAISRGESLAILINFCTLSASHSLKCHRTMLAIRVCTPPPPPSARRLIAIKIRYRSYTMTIVDR